MEERIRVGCEIGPSYGPAVMPWMCLVTCMQPQFETANQRAFIQLVLF
jgi:hypothetical protein